MELKIDLLLGADFYWNFVSERIIVGKLGPVAVQTSLGWVLSGRMEKGRGLSTKHTLASHVLAATVETEEEQGLDYLVQRFWKLDSVITPEENDLGVVEKFKESLIFDGSRYTVSLPWKQEIGVIPDNFSLLKRLRRNPKLLKQYDDIIKQQEIGGIVANVDPAQHEVGKVHYIPHREVLRDSDTNSLRIVYDGSAKVKDGISINDCLETGPCLLPKIFDILVRFRCFKYALTSDIKAACLNIRVNELERDFLRFLWFSDINKNEPAIVIKRLTSGLFGLNSSPFLLGMTINVHMNKYSETDEKVVEKLLRDIYMDDSITGAQTMNEDLELYSKSKRFMKEGGFSLVKWATIDEKLRQKIGSSEIDIFNETPCDKYEKERKVLGIKWNVREDTLGFSIGDVVKNALEHKFTSKRFIMKVIASIFDPIGILSPVTIKFKLILQEVFQLKRRWDEEIFGELSTKWEKTLKSVENIGPRCIPRNYFYGGELFDATSIE